MKTHTLTLGATGLVCVFLGITVGAIGQGVIDGPPPPVTPAPPSIAKGITRAQAEGHLDFGHADRMAVPCFSGYECSEWDGRKLKDGRFAWAVMFISPTVPQSLRPEIKRPANE